MEIGETEFVIVTSLTLIVIVATSLGFWVYKEKKRAARKLRELRDAISELKN